MEKTPENKALLERASKIKSQVYENGFYDKDDNKRVTEEGLITEAGAVVKEYEPDRDGGDLLKKATLYEEYDVKKDGGKSFIIPKSRGIDITDR